MRRIGFLAAIVALAACGGSDVTAPASPDSSVTLQVVSGQNDTALVNDVDLVSIRVLDTKNRPVPNQLVNWVITKGAGSVFVGATQTDSKGVSQNRWTLGAGDNTLEARAMSTQGTPLTFGVIKAFGKATTKLVLYAVPQSQPGAATSKVRASLVRADQVGGVTLKPWDADSMVYTVGDSAGYPTGPITLTLVTQVKDFSTPDSAGVPNTEVQWVVDNDQYSHDPHDVNSNFGLASSSSTTDATGTTTNTFTFDEPTLAVNGQYFYIEARLADSTGAFIKRAKFFIINWQQPTWLAYWDGKFPDGGFDNFHVAVTPDAPFDVATHLTFPVVEGADEHIGTLSIDHIIVGTTSDDLNTVDGCTVQGTVFSCSADAIASGVFVNVYPNVNDYPAGNFDKSAHTWFQLSQAP